MLASGEDGRFFPVLKKPPGDLSADGGFYKDGRGTVQQTDQGRGMRMLLLLKRGIMEKKGVFSPTRRVLSLQTGICSFTEDPRGSKQKFSKW